MYTRRIITGVWGGPTTAAAVLAATASIPRAAAVTQARTMHGASYQPSLGQRYSHNTYRPLTAQNAMMLMSTSSPLLVQRCCYLTTTPVRQSWLSRLFGGKATAEKADAAKDEPAAVDNSISVNDGPSESIAVLLKRLAEDKETPLTFLVKLMKNITAKLREKQTAELQSVVDETSAILANVRRSLQALVDKVAAAEKLLNQKKLPKAEERAKLEDADASTKSEGKNADEPKV